MIFIAVIFGLVNLGVIMTLYLFIFFIECYPKVFYKKIRMKRYTKGYSPSVSIFVPCKGINLYFEENINSILNIKYSKYRIFFIVESKDDPAYPVLENMISKNKYCSLVVAGKPEFTGQKNHNLIKGIEASGEKDDVYLFLDSDISISEDWITNLVLPLSDKNVTVSTGFKLHYLNKRTLGERIHSFMAILQWSMLNFIPFNGVWGGSMAILRSNFDELQIRKHWSTTVSDDMVMERELLKNKKKSVYVPECTAFSHDGILSVRESIKWFGRQTGWMKYYLHGLWLSALLFFIYMGLVICSLPLFAVLQIIIHSPTSLTFLLISCITCFFMLLCITIIARNIDLNHNMLSLLVLSPAYILASILGYVSAVFTRKVTWSGITYYLDKIGNVKKITRS